MATSSRIQPPSVNLKERIAALQQRSLSIDVRPSSPTAITPSPTSAGLRDKIAKFEKRGRVPAPRGSFGLGAPPPAENGPQKRRGELYGNRLPPRVRASFGSASLSRSDSPLGSARYFSVPNLDAEDNETPESLPYLPSNFPSPPSSPASSDTLTPITVVQSSATAFGNKDEVDRGLASSPSPLFTSPVSEISQREAEDEPLEAQVHVIPPSIVISSDDSLPDAEVPLVHGDEPVKEPEQSPDTVHPISMSSPPVVSAVPVTASPSVKVETNEPASRVEVTEPSATLPGPSSVSSPSSVSPPSVSTEEHVVELILDTTKVIQLTPEKGPSDTRTHIPSINPEPISLADTKKSILDTISQDVIPSSILREQVVLEPPSLPPNDHATVPAVGPQVAGEPAEPRIVVHPKTDDAISVDESTPRIGEQIIVPETKAKEDPPSPGSPIGPHTLANVVASLGQMVSDIHDMFSDQLSPLASPPIYRPMKLEPISDELSREKKQSALGKETKKHVDLTIRPDSEPEVAPEQIQPNTKSRPQTTTSRPEHEVPVADDTLNASSHTTESALLTASPTSSFLNTPASSRSRPMSMIETSPGQVAVGHRLTPFTGRTMYIPSQEQTRNLSHFPPTPGPQENDTNFGTVLMGHAPTHSKLASFSAVVHGKVTEMPPPSGMLNTPTTPRKRSSVVVRDGLLSPGQGELASLLQSAALLEETLEKGELPDEVTSNEVSDEQAKEEQERGEAAAKAKAQEQERKNETALKNRAQAQPQKRTKRTFRILQGKSTQRDPSRSSSDGQPINSIDLATRLPFRPQSSRQSSEGSSRPSEASSRRTLHAPSLEMHPESPAREMDASSQTPPKSPLQYLANLRRFASTGRPSSGSNSTHPRLSASTSSEMSSDDSVPLATPPDIDSAGSGSSLKSSHHGSGIPWPSLSPKKGSGGRAAAFAEKMWYRGRTRSNVSTKSAYDTIDRLTKSSAAKAAVASIPHLDPLAFSLEVPSPENSDTLLPSPQPQPDLVSPRRSKSFQPTSASQFPPVYTPVPTSPVYTPHKTPSTFRTALLPEDAMQPLHIDSLFLSGKGPAPARTTSPISEGVSEDSSNSSIISPLFDSFPSVPTSTSPSLPESPFLPHEHGHSRPETTNRPTLPLAATSFFDAAPLSSAVVGAEFLQGRSPAIPRSATLPPVSFDWKL